MLQSIATKLPEFLPICTDIYNTTNIDLIYKSNNKFHCIKSLQGTQQGDPLGMLLFCVGVASAYDQIANNDDVKAFAYADDLTVITTRCNATKVFKSVTSELKHLDLQVQPAKSQTYDPHSDHLSSTTSPTSRKAI